MTEHMLRQQRLRTSHLPRAADHLQKWRAAYQTEPDAFAAGPSATVGASSIWA